MRRVQLICTLLSLAAFAAETAADSCYDLERDGQADVTGAVAVSCGEPAPQPAKASSSSTCEGPKFPQRRWRWECGDELASVQSPKPGTSPHIWKVDGQKVCLTPGSYRGSDFKVTGNNVRYITAPGYTFPYDLHVVGHHIELVGDFSGTITAKPGQSNQINGVCF